MILFTHGNRDVPFACASGRTGCLRAEFLSFAPNFALTFSLSVGPAAPPEIRSVHKNCISQTTSWSPCSKSCGRGLSLRVSNANERCELVKESRLCNLRPCEVDITDYIKVARQPPSVFIRLDEVD